MLGRVRTASIGALIAMAVCITSRPAASPAGATPLKDPFVEPFPASRDHRAIQYTATRTTDAIARLNRRLSNGAVRLAFEPGSGYLKAVLHALNVPVESQVAVFARTSLQADRITPANPRAIFFNDAVAVAWPRGGFIEAAAIDPTQGAIFYTMSQAASSFPSFVRNDSTCLTCHVSPATLGVPGLAVASVVPDTTGLVADARPGVMDHRMPIAERWGGWYVTAKQLAMPHRGNLAAVDPDRPVLEATTAIEMTSLNGRFDTRSYPAVHSDVVAHLVLDHQTRMMNLLTRVGWETRVALAANPSTLGPLLRDAAREIVDYMLFVDEAPLAGVVEGSSGFAEVFASAGPRDRQGRSLRDLDLRHRLLRYPCSYLIYSEQFDRLPAQARDAIYARMRQVLSGEETAPRYLKLSSSDRQAIVEILRDTKQGVDF